MDTKLVTALVDAGADLETERLTQTYSLGIVDEFFQGNSKNAWSRSRAARNAADKAIELTLKPLEWTQEDIDRFGFPAAEDIPLFPVTSSTDSGTGCSVADGFRLLQRVWRARARKAEAECQALQRQLARVLEAKPADSGSGLAKAPECAPAAATASTATGNGFDGSLHSSEVAGEQGSSAKSSIASTRSTDEKEKAFKELRNLTQKKLKRAAHLMEKSRERAEDFRRVWVVRECVCVCA